MIVIEPVGPQARYPGQYRLPIIVPGGPEVEIPPRPEAQGKSSLWKWGLFAGLVGLVYSGSRASGSRPASIAIEAFVLRLGL